MRASSGLTGKRCTGGLLSISLAIAAALLPLRVTGQAHRAPEPTPIETWIPSPEPSGSRINDRVWLFIYPPRTLAALPAPAVALLHPLGELNNKLMRQFGRFFSNRGYTAVAMTLPYHMRRLPPHDYPLRHYASADIAIACQAYEQAAADVSGVVSWLEQRPGVDHARIGVIGVSLGAIIAHLAMGRDSRLSAGVAVLGGGDLADLYHRSALCRIVHPGATRPLTLAERAQIDRVDPLSYSDENRPRRVLMIQAARDIIIPPLDAERLWNALGRPPIRWLDTNHYAPALAARDIMQASDAYLRGVWSGIASPHIPAIHAPTLKLAMLLSPDFGVAESATWQALSFAARRDHMSLLHADVGISGRGPFVALAATVNAYIDVGAAQRLGGRCVAPYVSLHLVF